MHGKAMCVIYFLRASKVKIVSGPAPVLYSAAAAPYNPACRGHNVGCAPFYPVASHASFYGGGLSSDLNTLAAAHGSRVRRKGE